MKSRTVSVSCRWVVIVSPTHSYMRSASTSVLLQQQTLHTQNGHTGPMRCRRRKSPSRKRAETGVSPGFSETRAEVASAVASGSRPRASQTSSNTVSSWASAKWGCALSAPCRRWQSVASQIQRPETQEPLEKLMMIPLPVKKPPKPLKKWSARRVNEEYPPHASEQSEGCHLGSGQLELG